MATKFEQMVLKTIKNLEPEAYGAPIYEALEAAGQWITVSGLYVTLRRLEEQGLVQSRMGEATPERGGRRRQYFKVIEGHPTT